MDVLDSVYCIVRVENYRVHPHLVVARDTPTLDWNCDHVDRILGCNRWDFGIGRSSGLDQYAVE